MLKKQQNLVNKDEPILIFIYLILMLFYLKVATQHAYYPHNLQPKENLTPRWDLNPRSSDP
jgi:hypothetical protein